MNWNSLKHMFAGGLAVALAGGGFLLGRTQRIEPVTTLVPEAHASAEPAAKEPAPDPAEPAARGTRPSFANLVTKAEPAVVHVNVTKVVKAGATMNGNPFAGGDDDDSNGSPFPGMPGFRFPQPRQRDFTQKGAGSGFVIRKDGMVVTNNHVIDDAKDITVVFGDGRELSATVVGRDPKTDLAVLKVEGKGDLPVARLGDSDGLDVGDWVVAIGNPFGLSNTVTAGIVSAKGRAIGAGPYDDFIQTDAPINPGNSGGPLFNEAGEVVGINTMIFSQGGGNIGIGFAIPINLAKKLIPELEDKGHVTRGWLGVSIQKLTPELGESLGVTDGHGALVAQVTDGSPAATAGIEPGDVITTFDGKTVKDSAALPTLVAGSAIGGNVSVGLVRNGAAKTVEVKVAKLADETATNDKAPASGKWGLRLRELTPEDRAQRELDAKEGVLVGAVEPGSPAEEAGIKAGDVIVEANRKKVSSVAQVRDEAAKVADGKPLLLLVKPTDGNDRFAALSPR